MSTNITMKEWIKKAIEKSKAVEVNYGDYPVEEKVREILNESAGEDGMCALWRKEGKADVVRYVKAEDVRPGKIKLIGGLNFADNEFESDIALPPHMAILGSQQQWDHYHSDGKGNYTHAGTSATAKPDAIKMTPIRRGNRVIRLEHYQEGDQ